MKHAHILITALLLGACQTPAPATTATTDEASPVAATVEMAALAADSTEVENPDNVICRNMKVTGTRFNKRECKTAAVWAEFDSFTESNGRESTNNMQRLKSGDALRPPGE